MSLTLYYFPGCPFCHVVLDAVERLDLDVELRNIFEDAAYREELVEATGRSTVPCLRIEPRPGETRWMHESTDIVRFLEGASSPGG